MTRSRFFCGLIFFLVKILIPTYLLFGCGHTPAPETELNKEGAAQPRIEPTKETTPTPIPNLRAEAVLDETFSQYLPDAIDYDPLVTVDDLSDLQSQDELYLVDLRNPLVIKKTGYIPNAISIPLRELGKKSSVLPDFTVPIVTYCEAEWQCVIAQVGLGVYGWDIKILKGGVDGWLEAGGALEHSQIVVPEVDPLKPAFPCCGIYEISVESEEALQLNEDAPDAALVAAVDRMFDKIPANFGGISAEDLAHNLEQNPDLILLDLHLPSEVFSEGKLKAGNHLNVPLEKFIDMKDQWPTNLEANIIVYSQDERQSVIAMTILWIYGYRNVQFLIGGYDS